MSQPKPTRPFQLVDNKGQVFKENQLKHHWSLVFFGFSSCKMVCPFALQTFNEIYDSFLKKNQVQVIFISVDPERDSIVRLNQFVQGINKDFIALRGSMPAINGLQRQWKVAISSNAASHGREILLLNPEAQVQAYFYYPIEPKALLSDLQMLINKTKSGPV